jgi:DNA-binding HxlR family transcriptional regulator
MKKQIYNCPAELTVSLLDGKWKAYIIYNLRKGPKRFGELRRMTVNVSQAILTRQLKELEEFGIVERTEIGKERTAGVEYALTERGESLKPILYSMVKWGLANQKDYVLGEFKALNNVKA